MKSSINAFVVGIGTILDSLVTSFRPQTLSKNSYYKNDTEALKNDWNMVGKSLRGGLNEYKSSQAYCSTKK